MESLNINVICQLNNNNQFEIPKELAFQLMGKQWPKSEDYGYPPGFTWEEVDHFIVESGTLVPYKNGLPMSGPDLRLDAVPNPSTRVTVDNSDLY